MVRQASAASILPEIRHYKFGLSWPVDENGLNEFVGGLDHVLVIEEKAPIIENQLKDILFNRTRRPVVQGKLDLNGDTLIPAQGQLSPTLVARALRRWLSQAAGIVLDKPAAQAQALSLGENGKMCGRLYFCPGCKL